MRFIDMYDIEAMARTAYGSGIHLADSRDDWLKLIMSMVGGGKQLLEPFLLLSSMAGKKYKERESEREFLKAVRKSSDVALSYFLKQCELYGLSRNDYRIRWRTPERQSSNSSNSCRQNRQNYNQTTQISQNMATEYTMKPLQTIDFSYLAKSRSNNSSFLRSVVGTGLLTDEEAQEAAKLFRLGATRNGSVIYWQIDTAGRVRDGKMMAYDEHCHRCKDKQVNWVGSKLREQKVLKNWEATHCLFGLHQLAERPNDTVCIVEAEKTAVICSQKAKDFVWMASGGLSALSPQLLKDLEGHRVILYPDTDPQGEAYAKWYDIAWKAKTILGLNISISDILERNATAEQKEAKIDIADFIACDTAKEAADPNDDEAAANGETEKAKDASSLLAIPEMQEGYATTKEEMLAEMAAKNPAIGYLVEMLDLVIVDSG